MEKLFGSPGKKIKLLAKILFWVIIAAGVIFSFAVADEVRDVEAFPVFLLTIVISVAVAWVNGLFLYGFGEIIEQLETANKRLRDVAKNTENE